MKEDPLVAVEALVETIRYLPTASRLELQDCEPFYLSLNALDLMLAAPVPYDLPLVCPVPAGYLHLAHEISFKEGDAEIFLHRLFWWQRAGRTHVIFATCLVGADGTQHKDRWLAGSTVATSCTLEEQRQEVERLHQQEHPEGGEDAWMALWEFLWSACLFIQDPIIEVSQLVAPRALRRRLEREQWRHEPLVRVVAPPAKHYLARAGEGRDVEWQHQWIVRGHWHTYWTGKKDAPQQKVVRWLTPYVKGPEDKPLKKPAATVFAVVR